MLRSFSFSQLLLGFNYTVRKWLNSYITNNGSVRLQNIFVSSRWCANVRCACQNKRGGGMYACYGLVMTWPGKNAGLKPHRPLGWIIFQEGNIGPYPRCPILIRITACKRCPQSALCFTSQAVLSTSTGVQKQIIAQSNGNRGEAQPATEKIQYIWLHVKVWPTQVCCSLEKHMNTETNSQAQKTATYFRSTIILTGEFK